MNKFIYMGVGALAATIVGVGVFVGLKTRKALSTTTPIAAVGSENETLQVTSIQETTDEALATQLEKTYQKLSTFLMFGKVGDREEGALLDKLMDAKLVRPLVVNGSNLIGTATVEEADVLMEIAQTPHHFTSGHEKQTILYIANYEPTDSAVIVIKHHDLHFVMYKPKDNLFVVNGTLLDSTNTFGFLQLLLGILMDQWDI